MCPVNFWYWLLSWLPFEWAAPDTMLFMKNALLAVLVVTPLFGLLSTMVVESRMAFFSDALGHSAFTGMAIGALCGLAQPVQPLAIIFVIPISYIGVFLTFYWFKLNFDQGGDRKSVA